MNFLLRLNLKQVSMYFGLVILAAGIYGCGGGEKKGPPGAAEKKEPITFEQATKDWRSNKGIGPVKEVVLGEIDPALVESGRNTFDLNCTACHEPYKEKIGPALVGITERRTPEWIMNMMLNPEEMAKTDPICLGLLAQYNVVMANQKLTEDESRQILEFFRTLKMENTAQ